MNIAVEAPRHRSPGCRLHVKILCGSLCAASAACAIEMEWVKVGDPGNSPDRTGYGSVAYEFEIGKFEVTVAQYLEFLNTIDADGPNGVGKQSAVRSMRSAEPGKPIYAVPDADSQKPIRGIRFADAMRFANWMHQGCGRCDTETGAYNISKHGPFAPREPGARFALTSEDEWYKAAYYQPESKGGPSGSYWLYPTRSNQMPGFDAAGSTQANHANYFPLELTKWDGTIPRKAQDVLPVGSYTQAHSYYGTYDQGGNVWEWNEAIVFGSQRGLRGGCVLNTYEKMRSWVRSHVPPDGTDFRFTSDATGFRLVRLMPASDKTENQNGDTLR